jgi:hypothetical protein
MMRVSVCFALLVLASAPASAQLLAAKDGPVVYGHHHLNVTSIDEHKKFWVNMLGGTSVKVGTSPNEIVMLPNVLVFLRQQAPAGGTKGTTVNHLAFAVTNLRQAVDKARAAGYRIATREEAGAYDEVKDDIAFNKEQQTYSAFVMGPDEVKVQLFEVKTNRTPIALHHVHFAGPAAEMRAWYVKSSARSRARVASLKRRTSRASTCRSRRQPLPSWARAAASSITSGSR